MVFLDGRAAVVYSANDSISTLIYFLLWKAIYPRIEVGSYFCYNIASKSFPLFSSQFNIKSNRKSLCPVWALMLFRLSNMQYMSKVNNKNRKNWTHVPSLLKVNNNYIRWRSLIFMLRNGFWILNKFWEFLQISRSTHP